MKALLLTGEKNVGKTTALRRLIAGPVRERCHGFYTEEIQRDGRRIAFQIVTLDGLHKAIIATRDEERLIEAEYRMGNYIVHMEALEGIALPSIEAAIAQAGVTVIDEIGPMQLLSKRFRSAIERVLSSPGFLLGTIVQREHPWTDGVKRRNDASIYTLTLTNRDHETRIVEETLYRKLGLPLPDAGPR